MQASVRRFLVVAAGATLALMLFAGASAALAYETEKPRTTTPVQVWNPKYSVVEFARKNPTEGGPVEMPHPLPVEPEGFSANPNMGGPSVSTPDGKPGASSLPGALPTGRGAGAILDAATRAEHSIQQVIRKLR